MRDDQKQLKLGALLSYLSVGLSLLTGLVYTPWMVGKLGSSQYGLYTLANSLISLFLLDFGLSSATAKFVSEYHARGEEERINRFLGTIYKLYLLIDAVILAVLAAVYFLIDIIYVRLTPQELEQFKVVYLIAGSFSIISFPFVTLNGILTAYEQFVPLKLADVMHKLLQLGIMVAALSAGYGLYALVSVHAVVGLLMIGYKLIVIRKRTQVHVNFRFAEAGLYRELFGFSIWSTVAAMAQRLVFNITPSVLGVVSSTAAIAVFGVVTTIESNVYLLIGAIDGMFMPRISRIYARGQDSEGQLFHLLMNVGCYQFGLSGLVVAGFTVLGKEFVDLWMGQQYADAYLGILLVIIPGAFYSALQIANTAIVVKKQVKFFAVVTLLVGLTSVGLSLPLSARYGAIGSCAAICIAYFIRAVLLNILYSKKLHLDMKQFVRKCYVRMSVPVLLTILICAPVERILPGTGWGWLIGKAVVITAVYVVMVLSVGIEGGWRKLGRMLRKSA